MKTNFTELVWLIILLLFTFSCSKSDDNLNGSNNKTSGFPTKGIIYFWDNGTWVIDANGSNNRQFATVPGFESALSSSSDGTKFIFHRQFTGLVVLNKDGEKVVIADDQMLGDAMVTWSKVGKIYFSRNKKPIAGGRYIYAMNEDGTGLTQITPDFLDPNISNEPWDNMPSVSPDNKSILFTSQRSGNLAVLAKMNLENRQITYLTYPDGMNGSGTMGVYTAAYPSFSPDGSKIVFVGNIDNTLPKAEQDHAQVFIMNADGSGKTSLTHMTIENCTYPSWSPDGTMIVFQKDSLFYTKICVMNANGSNLKVLGNGASPCFIGQPK